MNISVSELIDLMDVVRGEAREECYEEGMDNLRQATTPKDVEERNEVIRGLEGEIELFKESARHYQGEIDKLNADLTWYKDEYPRLQSLHAEKSQALRDTWTRVKELEATLADKEKEVERLKENCAWYKSDGAKKLQAIIDKLQADLLTRDQAVQFYKDRAAAREKEAGEWRAKITQMEDVAERRRQEIAELEARVTDLIGTAERFKGLADEKNARIKELHSVIANRDQAIEKLQAQLEAMKQ